MARLKLDLHPIFSDSARIEAALEAIVREAEEKRIEEVEIIPGKGSGALKKTVLRFLNRPDVKTKYHRIVKDSENWGRLFVYFRWGPLQGAVSRESKSDSALQEYACYFCGAINELDPEGVGEGTVIAECPACGSPNQLTIRKIGARWRISVSSGWRGDPCESSE